MPTYYLGLDVHEVLTRYCLVDVLGEILSEGNVPTEEAASLISEVDTSVVLEATGSWHATYDALVATGARSQAGPSGSRQGHRLRRSEDR